MAWFSKIFSAVGVDLVGTVGKVLDDLTTSDEEVRLSDNQKMKIKTALGVSI